MERRRHEEERGGRDRGDDRGGRDRERSRDDRGGRDDRGSRDRDSGGREERGSRRGGSSYEYVPRSREQHRQRENKGGNNDFDAYLAAHVKTWKPNDGDNRIRILPPTWKGADHYGLDIFMHYGVGADRQSYLCPVKHDKGACPICEERDQFRRDADPDNEKDTKLLKDMEAKRRVLVYIVDRDNEKEGVQAWAMPWTMDRDIVKVSVDKSNGEVLPIDSPTEGYDVEFERKGKADRTEYIGVAIGRRSCELGKSEWMEFAVDNPLPEQLVFFDEAHIAKTFGGAGAHKGGEDRGGRDRDDRGGRDREPERGRGSDDRGSRERDSGSSRRESDDPTWESVHAMTEREMKDLIEVERLDINPREAKDEDDLADWICEEMKLTKPEARERRRMDDSPADTESRMRGLRDRIRD